MLVVINKPEHADDDFPKLVILKSVHPGQSSALRFPINEPIWWVILPFSPDYRLSEENRALLRTVKSKATEFHALYILKY